MNPLFANLFVRIAVLIVTPVTAGGVIFALQHQNKPEPARSIVQEIKEPESSLQTFLPSPSQQPVEPSPSPSPTYSAQKRSEQERIAKVITPTPTLPPSDKPKAPEPSPTLIPTIEKTTSPSPTVKGATTSIDRPAQVLKAQFTASGFRDTKVFSYTTQIFRGDTVIFDASSSTGNIIAYEWDFGDGTTGTGKVISHTYNVSSQIFSNFNVKLTVKDSEGKKDQSGGYYIHYLGEPRMLISVVPIPDAEARRYACGQTVKAAAIAYSPWGDITQLRWEINGATSAENLVTDKNGQPALILDCDRVARDATAQGHPGYAGYSFIVREFRDSVGNIITYSRENAFGQIGLLTITAYIP